MTGIYVLRNMITGKVYVGQSTNIERRMREHRKADSRRLIGAAIKKYGWASFERHIYYLPEELLDFFEQEMIMRLNTISPVGYNLDFGGFQNKHFSSAVKEKMSDSAKRRIARGHPMLGRHHSLESRLAISRKLLGRKRSQEAKSRMSESRRGENNPMYGKQRSEETRRKISLARKGMIVPVEIRNKISLTCMGRIPWNKGRKSSYELQSTEDNYRCPSLLGRVVGL